MLLTPSSVQDGRSQPRAIRAEMSIGLRSRNAGIEKMSNLGSSIEDGFRAGGGGRMGRGVMGTARRNKNS